MNMKRLLRKKKRPTENSDETADVNDASRTVNDASVHHSIQTVSSNANDASTENDDQGDIHDNDDDRQRFPHRDSHSRRLNPFLFPTLADLPGLLLSSSPGSVFCSQWQLIRRMQLQQDTRRQFARGIANQKEEIIVETLSAFAKRNDEIAPNTLENELAGKHFVRIRTESGQGIEDELVEIVDSLPVRQVIPTKVDAFLASHRPALMEVVSEASEESVGLVNDDSKAYYRRIYITLFLLGLIILTYFVGATIIFLKLKKPGNPYTCRTPSCMRMAHWIKSAMDLSVHPCDDFYRFACGTYIKNHPVTTESPNELHLYRSGIPINFMENEKVGNLLKKVDTFPDNQLLPFYQACIDTRRRDKHGVQPFIQLLSQIRILYIQSGSYFNIISRFNVARVIGRIYRRTNRLFFFDFEEVKDNIILLKLAKPPQEIILTPPKVYADAMRKTWKIFGKDLMVDDEEIETIVYLVMRFEAELGIIQSKETVNYIFGFPMHFDEEIPPPAKFHQNYIKMRGRFEWQELVAAVMGYTPGNYEEYHITFNLWSSFHSKQDRYYALYMEDRLRNTPSYVIYFIRILFASVRYFQWELMKMFAFDLNKEIQDIMLAIFRVSGRNVVERCFASVFSNLHFVAAHRYKAMISDTTSIYNNMTTITKKVFEVYSETVNKLSLPVTMKASLLATGKTLKITMMDPESKLDEYSRVFYKGLNCSKEHFANVVKAKSIKARNVVMFIKKEPPFDKWWDGEYSLTEWTETSIADAWSTVRYLHIPFGAIQEPFLGNDLPILNYAGFGHYLVSHSLIKFAFNDLIQIYEANYKIWEPYEKVTAFKEFQRVFLDITECVINTQSQLTLKDYPDIKVNPNVRETKLRMFSETFALELTSLVIDTLMNATDAMKGSVAPYKSPMEELLRANEMIGERFPKYQVLPGLEKYTPDQLVFLSMARHHCQSYSRARAEIRLKEGPLLNELVIHGNFRNLIDFAENWECPKDSYMNPRRRCRLFTGKTDETKGNQESASIMDVTGLIEHNDEDDSYYYDDDDLAE